MASTNQEIQELRNDIAALQDSLADKLESTVANGKSKSKAIQYDIQQFAENAGKKTRALLHNSKDQIVDTRDRAEYQIVSHPFLSTALAFAGGLAIAKLLSSSRS